MRHHPTSGLPPASASPSDALLAPRPCVASLNDNDLTDGGTDMSGIVQLTEWMKQTHSLKQLECAPQSLKGGERPLTP